MFKHQKIMLITALVLTSFGGTTTAHAATWHSGTPKAIRGHWIYKKSKWIFGYYYVRANQIYSQDAQASSLRKHKIAYKELGHGRYKLRYISGYPGSNFIDHVQYGYVLKRHGKIRVTDDYGNRADLKKWYHRGSYTSLNRANVQMTRPFS